MENTHVCITTLAKGGDARTWRRAMPAMPTSFATPTRLELKCSLCRSALRTNFSSRHSHIFTVSSGRGLGGHISAHTTG